MVSYGNTVQTLDVWLNEGIVDFRNNRFQCLFLAYIFPKLSIYRQGILLKQWNAGEIIMYILQSGLIGPSKRYLRIIIYMDARRIIWEQGDYFLLPMRSCNGQKQNSKFIAYYKPIRQAEQMLEAQQAYCQQIHLKHTPFITVNEREMPQVYDIEDVQYV